MVNTSDYSDETLPVLLDRVRGIIASNLAEEIDVQRIEV